VKHLGTRSEAVFATLLTAAVLAMLPATAFAGDAAWLPKLSRGQGDACVADTDWMRRNHMTALMHQRDDTVRDGMRDKRFSLKGCVDCHAVEGADGKPVTAASPRHFCRSCHDFAAVRMDCFECHASRPDTKTGATGGLLPARPPFIDTAFRAQETGRPKQ